MSALNPSRLVGRNCATQLIVLPARHCCRGLIVQGEIDVGDGRGIAHVAHYQGSAAILRTEEDVNVVVVHMREIVEDQVDIGDRAIGESLTSMVEG